MPNGGDRATEYVVQHDMGIRIFGTFPSVKAISKERRLECSFNLDKMVSRFSRGEA